MNSAADERRYLTRVLALAGLIAVVGYATLAAVQILVLNPMAAVPDTSLPDIYARMDAAGERMPVAMPLIALGVGVAAAIVVAAVSVRSRLDPSHTGLLFLVLLALGTPGYFVASFGPGMSLADAFGLSGADHSVWAMPLHLVSAAAAVAAVALAMRASPRRRVGTVKG